MSKMFPFLISECPHCHSGNVWGDYSSNDYQWYWWYGEMDEITYCPNCGKKLKPKKPITKAEYFKAHGWTLPNNG